MLNMFAAMAQFDREIMLERQREGIAKAKAQGKYKVTLPAPKPVEQPPQRLLLDATAKWPWWRRIAG